MLRIKVFTVNRHEDDAIWVPSWVSNLGTAVWIRDPDGRINYMNKKAEDLLGLSATECIGRRCHLVVAGMDFSGNLHCLENCPLVCQAESDKPIEATRLQIIGFGGHRRWIKVLPIKVSTRNRPGYLLVHCVIDDGRTHHIEEYLGKVYSRTRHSEDEDPSLRTVKLTKREKEILQLLAEDERLYSIAGKLHLSHNTIRNHVQHVLSKLGVHSIIEAVAYYLLVKK